MRAYKIILPSSSIYCEQDCCCLETEKMFLDCPATVIERKDIESYTLTVDNSWHIEKYGFKLTQSETDIFHMHRLSWINFLESGDGYCLIIDNTLKVDQHVLLDMSDFEQLESWDVIFPFDENDILNQKDVLSSISILNTNMHEENDYDPYLLSRKWCSSIYILSRSGAEKLLQLKTITQVVEDEILLLSYEGKLNVYCTPVSWFDYSRQPIVINLERECEIYRAIIEGSSWNDIDLVKIRSLLAILSDISAKLNIDLILQGGSLLGYIQHGGIMPWDDDVDLGISHQDLNRFLEELEGNSYIRFDKFFEGKTNNTEYYRIWMNDGTDIGSDINGFPFIDLWSYNIVGDDIVFLNGIICPNSMGQNFRKVIFEGSSFSIPFNSIECLNERYKTWQTLIRVYRWSHKKNEGSFYPLKVHIKCDDQGRMIAPLFNLLQLQE